jgi:hypothetical protein
MQRFIRSAATLAAIALVLACTGCRTRLGDMSVVSTRHANLENIDLSTLPEARTAVGKSSRPVFLLIPLGFPNLEDAIDEALEQGEGDLMIDAVIYAEGWWFLVGQNGIVVEGKVLNNRGTRP